jgi:phage terminase small subunit
MIAENAGKPLQNAKHEAVLQSYFADPERVGYRCYISVYPNSSESAAKTGFSRLLKNADFRARLDFLTAGVAKVVSEKVAITVENVINELAKLGFSNMENYFRAGDDGVPRLRISDLSSDQLAALQEISIEEEIEPGTDDEMPTIVRKTKFKLYDKRAALVDIGKHLGAFKDKLELTGKDGGPIEVKEEISELELARRIAFALEQGARSARPAAAAAPAPKPKAAKPKKKKGKTP